MHAEGRIDTDDAAGGIRPHDYGQHAVHLHRASRASRTAASRGNASRPPVRSRCCRARHAYAVVLTCQACDSERIAALDDVDFLRAAAAALRSARATSPASGPRLVFPLGLRVRRISVGDREVWIGNAAQTLHPVAGQGFNLALRDIMELADTLTDATDPGDAQLLARYAARRKFDRIGTIGFTDSLVRLFSNTIPPLRHARGAGLLALDLLPAARSFLARRMMFGARGF